MSNQSFNDWQPLVEKAKQASQNAYAPYSHFSVGAAAYTSTGKIIAGCNVENASFGLTVCAERNCIGHAVVNGEQKFTSMVIYTEQTKLTPPCGACRQVIAEFFESSAQVMAVNHLDQRKIWSVFELLPDAFTPQDLINKD
ncbi:MAG: cytidine deaminase [Alteromonadaceae bacterium]|nr:cytidine deaminase [Alteromonadaceae bacterium]